MIKHCTLGGQAAMACMVAAAWVKPDKLWQWKAALLAQEFGHWFAVVSLLLAIIAWQVFDGWKRGVLAVIALALAAVLMAPAVQASQLVEGFSWSRLWLPWVGGHAEVTMERRTFWQGDGESLDLLVYHPGKQSVARPWVLVAHTGGWDGGSADEFRAWNAELASHNVVVIAMNYRLAPRHQWPAQRDDVVHAVAWARAHAGELGIDPARLILMGRSAGGQIASACAYGLPELKARGCILFYSPFDMNFARRYAYAEDILNSLQLLRQYLGGDPEQSPENYHSASAIDFVNASTPPTLLLHGARDSLVWVEQSRRLAKRLDEAGVPHRFLEPQWATHGCDYFPGTPDGQLSMQAVVKFIAGLP